MLFVRAVNKGCMNKARLGTLIPGYRFTTSLVQRVLVLEKLNETKLNCTSGCGNTERLTGLRE